MAAAAVVGGGHELDRRGDRQWKVGNGEKRKRKESKKELHCLVLI